MVNTVLTVRVRVEGVRETVAAFRKLPKNAATELRGATKELAGDLARQVRADGLSDSAPQSANVSRTIRVNLGAMPNISMGGSRRLGRNRAPAFKMMFGAVFGSNRYKQFHRRHRGKDAYWFFPVVEEEAPRIAAAWQKVAEEIISEFGEVTGGR